MTEGIYLSERIIQIVCVLFGIIVIIVPALFGVKKLLNKGKGKDNQKLKTGKNRQEEF